MHAKELERIRADVAQLDDVVQPVSHAAGQLQAEQQVPCCSQHLLSSHAVTLWHMILWTRRNMNIQTQDWSRKFLLEASNQLHCNESVKGGLGEQMGRGERGVDLLVEALHGQKACLRLFGALFGGLGGGEGLAIQGSEVGLGPQEARHEKVEEGPQLQHIVLDGSACQDEAVLRYHSLACLQPLGFISGGEAGGGGGRKAD